ncbi:sel1 repeat family protein [Pseudoalteromonas piscicida]|uniref:tetratricopeptide repeat protein n=1 Tax=Pseudoalteromonas piscicida TaxID=43662 RepID=UPI0030B60470
MNNKNMEIKSHFFSFYDTLLEQLNKHKILLGVATFILVALYFYHQKQQEIASYQGYLSAPKVDDLIIFDAGRQSEQVYDPAFQVLQITELTDDTIEVKEGAYTYRTMRNITRDIRVSMLMTDKYFKLQRSTLERDQLLALLDNNTIVAVYRPVGIHVFGGVVRPRFKKPKPLYHGPGISAQNQAGVRAYVKEDFQVARQEFAAAAASGSQWGQYNYATMLRDGEGGEKDLKAAIHWLQLAAKQGNDKAKAALTELCKTHHC